MLSGNQYGNHEMTYTWNRGEQKEFWLLVLRIYISGDSTGYRGDDMHINQAAIYSNAMGGLSSDCNSDEDRVVCCSVS